MKLHRLELVKSKLGRRKTKIKRKGKNYPCIYLLMYFSFEVMQLILSSDV